MPERYDRIPDVFPVLHPGDLLLREVDARDAGAWFARNSDPGGAIAGGGDVMTDPAEALAAIKSVRAAFRRKTKLRWAIVPPGAAVAIGSTGFNAFSARDLSAELGYGLAKEHWGRGIMTAATRACVEYAFGALALNRIEATVLDDNLRSMRVLEKLGFRREGIAREYKLVDGRPRDCWLCALVRRDWQAARFG